jgi:filamentous hemagglutinin family protein
MSVRRAGKRARKAMRRDLPLVSCIMPTYNRRRFVPEAIRLFLTQDYPKKELVVLDDGEDNIADLIPSRPQIRYMRLDRRHSIGAKRNIACEAARGEIIAHWDDDDWYAPWRLSRQVAKIVSGGADLCGLGRMLFFDPTVQRAWEYVYPAGAPAWVYGATFCYRKSIWQQNPFLDNTGCEDNLFIANLAADLRLQALHEPGMFVGLVHSANSSPKRTQDPLWRPQPIERIRRVVRNNWTPVRGRGVGSDAGQRPVSAVSTAFGAAAAVAGALSVTVAPASANPKGGQVSAGSATITQTSPSRLDVVQSTDRAAIDWQSFSIAPTEQTNFQQPAASSVTLNRVQPGDPSVIAGKLTANGQVVLINPSGITFSKGAVVDVNSLVATPTDISNSNFMAGQMRFDKPSSDPRARVVNQGTITVAQKGLAALVAPAAKNSGTIQAKLGKVVLGGAQTYTVDFYGDGLISFDVGSEVTAVPTRPDGRPVKSLVSNTGRIDAPGGTVLLTADAAAGIVENVVDVRGRITAKTSGQTPGSVTIDAGPAGAATVSSKIDVSGLKPGQTGGSATVTGGSVNLANGARIGARGNAGGGTVKIGGGPHGQDPTVRNAQNATVAAGAVIDASAVGSGNGGQVTVWSDQETTFAGAIKARGGPGGGDGGWVETSGKSGLSVLPSAQVDAAAPMGKAGDWLLDPANLTVGDSNSNITPADGPSASSPTVMPTGGGNATVNAATVSSTLNGGTNVTLTTVNSPTTSPPENGDITVNATSPPISWNTAAQLTLNAARNIVIDTPIIGSNAGSTLALNAGLASPGFIQEFGAITIGTLTGSSTGGTFMDFPQAVNHIANLGSFTDSSASFGISLTNAQPLTVTGPVSVNTKTGSLNLTTTGAGSDMTLAAAAGLTGSAVTLTSAGVITQTAGMITTGSLQVEATGQVTLGGPNAVGLLAATVSGAGNGFMFRNDQHNLTIQSVPGDGTGFRGITTNGGPIEVVTTGTSTNGFNLTIANNPGPPPLTTSVSSSGGPITLMAGGHGGTFTNAGIINSTSSSPPAAADIVILADAMALHGGTITAAAPGHPAGVVLGPVTPTTSVVLGTPAPSGSLNLMQSDLDSISSAAVLQVGYRNINGTPSLTGNINIVSPISTNMSLLLVTDGGVTESPGAFISSTTGSPLPLGVIAGGSVVMNQANQAGILAGFDDGGATNSFVYRNDGAPLSIGTLSASTIGVDLGATGIPTAGNMTGPATNPLSGITTNGGAETVATTGLTGGVATLTVAPAVSIASSGGAITLMAGGVGATFTNQGRIDSTAAAPAAAGNIAIVADAISFGSIPGTINAGTRGTVMLGPFTAANEIALGATGSPGVFGLAPTNLASITAGLLQVGYRNVNGTPSLTGSIDIAAPTTIDTTKIGGLLLVTGGGVTESPGAFINSTSGGPPLALGVVADGSVFLGLTNQAGVLAGFVDGAATNGFLYRNNGAGLTVGTLPGPTLGVAFDPTTGIPSTAKMGGPATNPLAGVTTAGGNILLETTTSGNLALSQPVNAGSGVVTLNSAGTITEPAGGLITAATLTGTSVGGTTLNQTNLLTNLGPFTNAGAGGFALTDGETLDVTGAVGAGTGGLALTTTIGNLVVGAGLTAGTTVTLNSTGTITEPVGGLITAATLTGASVGGTTLNQTNLMTNLGPFANAGAGGFALTNGQTLNMTGAVDAGTGGLALTTTSGNLVVGAGLTAGTAATLNSAGAITEPAGGLITAATLTGASVGGTTLNQTNLLTNLGPFTNAGAGGFALTDGQTLNMTGAVNGGTGSLALTTTSGNLVVGAGLSAGTTVTLNSAGTITEPVGGLITAATLTGASVGGTTLNQTNLLTNLGPFTNAGAGGFALTNGQTLNTNGAVDAGTGGLALTTTSGNLVVGAGLSAGTTVTLNSAGTITEPVGGSITAATLTGASVGGGSLTQGNSVGTLGPFSNLTSGLLSFTNAQPLTTAGVVHSAGGLTVTTTGAGSNLTVGGGLTASGQTVTLTSAGTITEQPGGAITAGMLSGSSAGNASLDQGNLLTNLGPFTTTASGTFTLTDDQALTVSGPLNSAGDLRIRVNTGDLTLVGNITAGGGNSDAALVAMAGNVSELDDPVVTASGLIIEAAGNVSFGVNGGKVFPADANAVGTLAGTAGGSFGFLNGPALTVGTVPATGGVASQSGISASATTAGDVLIQTNNLGQPLALAGNIIAGGRAILDTAGGFSQGGAVTVTAPVLAIDTTGSGIGPLLGFITSTNVNANVIAGLPPAGKTSNPMQFANLSAPNSVVLLFADQGAVAGTIQAGQLGLSGIGSGANLRGSISGVSDPTAALLGVRDPEPALTYLFNDCIIAAVSCFVPSVVLPPELLAVQPQSASAATVLAPGFLVVQPQSVSGVTVFDLLPDIAATTDFITPEGVTPEGLTPEGVRAWRQLQDPYAPMAQPQSQDPDAPMARRQLQDPDAPVINIFDEERLCEQSARSSQPKRERCR